MRRVLNHKVDVERNTGSGCPGEIPSEVTWHFTSDPDVEIGRFVCFHYDGKSWIAWTYDELGLLGEGYRNDFDDQALDAWWSKGVFLQE